MLNITIGILITVCITTYVSVYLLGIKRGRVKPVLATWLFFSIGSIISFATDYKETGLVGIAANLFNIVDMLAVISICAFAFLRRDTRRTFNSFEKFCLASVAVIFLGWLASGQNIVAHLAIQCIFIVAYLPTVVHLWKAKENTESLTAWSFDCAAAVFGIIIPLMTHDLLSTVYDVRAIISALVTIALILRLKYKKTHAS